MVDNWLRRHWLIKRLRPAEVDAKWLYERTARRRTNLATLVTLVIGILQLRPGMRVTAWARRPGTYSVDNADEEREPISLSKTVILPEAIDVLDYEELSE